MTNNLNQVLIEGDVTDTPEEKDADGNTSFIIESRRVSQPEPSRFRIDVAGKFADACIEHIRLGTGVRVIGMIGYDRAGHFRIVADHVIFKPETTKPRLVK